MIIDKRHHLIWASIESIVRNRRCQVCKRFIIAIDVSEGKGEREIEQMRKRSLSLYVVDFFRVAVEILAQEHDIGMFLLESLIEFVPKVDSDVFDGVESQARYIGNVEPFLSRIQQILINFWVILIEIGQAVDLTFDELSWIVPIFDRQSGMKPIGFFFDEGRSITDVIDDEIEYH